MIKSVVCLAAVVMFVGNTPAQQRVPPIGGTVVADPVSSSDAERGRRAVMRDTLNLQYSAKEIEEYRRRIDSFERQRSGVYGEAATVVRRRIVLDLSPEAKVPELRFDAENISTLVFVDGLGNPWQLADAGTPNFVTGAKHKHMLVLSPSAAEGGGKGSAPRFGRSNLTVILEGFDSPIPFAVSYGLGKEVDGLVEVVVPGRNPSARLSALQPTSFESDDFFSAFLDGEPPKEATKVRTSAQGVDAWSFKGMLYVRTSLALHSPSFHMYGGSASGLGVYRFNRAPSLINAIVDGAIVTIGIGE